LEVDEKLVHAREGVGFSPQYMAYEAIYQRLDPRERRRPAQWTALRLGLEPPFHPGWL